jgi:catechol 2,3-dioxygenase-like lactoylglutathione lyase family enzyme
MTQPPPLTQQISFLYVEDLAACRHFYEGALRLAPVQVQEGCVIYAAAPGGRAFLGVCLARGPRQTDDPRRVGGVVVTLVSPEVEAWHAWLVAQGVAVQGSPALSADGGITHFFFHDPAGYLLEIQRFERQDWPRPEA